MKKLKISLIALAITLFAGYTLFGQQIKRLHTTMTLFDEDVIISNFSNMASLYQSTEISPSAPASKFEISLQPLPKIYRYKDHEKGIQDYIKKTSTTALLVIKNNTITFENYYQGTSSKDHRISWSTSKSFLSALFGIAVHEGRIKSLDEKVTDYVPELKGTGYDNVRIKDVLQMSSGVGFNEDYMDFNSDINRFGRAFALGQSLDEFAGSLNNVREPGVFHHYISFDTHVLGMILRAATGHTIADYFESRLWSKIQPEASAHYIVDNLNEPLVLGGLNLRTRDYARFGQLYLNNGNWNGEQIVPAEWVEHSTTPDAPHLMPGKRNTSTRILGYGYQWWIPERADEEFMAVGIYGQYVYVNQKAGVVIVKNSADINFADNDYESTIETVEFFRAIAASI